MNQPTKLAVSPAKATELMAQGYQIECYVILPEPCAPKRKASTPHIPDNVMVSLSVKPEQEPKMGEIANMWELVKTKFFNGDPTKRATRRRLEEWVVKNGGKKNQVSQFLHAYKCIRVVDDTKE